MFLIRVMVCKRKCLTQMFRVILNLILSIAPFYVVSHINLIEVLEIPLNADKLVQSNLKIDDTFLTECL